MEHDLRSYKKQLEILLKVVDAGESGYRHAAEKVNSSELKELLIKYADEHEQICKDIQTKITEHGGNAPREDNDDNLGLLTRAKLNLETAFEDDANEKAALGLCKERDLSALDKFDDVLQGSILETDLKPFLMTQRAKISAAYDRMEKLYFEKFRSSPEI